MKDSMFVTFRGEEHDINFICHEDMETNSCEVEWWFSDPAMKDVEVTPEEEEEITTKIVERTSEPGWYDESDLLHDGEWY